MQEMIQRKDMLVGIDVNICLKNIKYEGVGWINLAQCTDQRRGVMIKAINFRSHKGK
jgi:hypothetical protein